MNFVNSMVTVFVLALSITASAQENCGMGAKYCDRDIFVTTHQDDVRYIGAVISRRLDAACRVNVVWYADKIWDNGQKSKQFLIKVGAINEGADCSEKVKGIIEHEVPTAYVQILGQSLLRFIN